MSAAIAPIQPTEAPIFGYAHSSTFFCNGCIEGALFNNTYSTLHSAEQALDLIADDWNIDRTREATYSFADFPKILRENNGAHCADCGGRLDKDLRDPESTITRVLCGADHKAGESCRLADGAPDGAHTIVAGASS
jgi:hypothetical protein